ncbi:hypothetical protein E2542_SST02033 [Spatholobus suberectus]|nr:hypothetical protein E2542_SST02033 [Spatholobus suberectus]
MMTASERARTQYPTISLYRYIFPMFLSFCLLTPILQTPILQTLSLQLLHHRAYSIATDVLHYTHVAIVDTNPTLTLFSPLYNSSITTATVDVLHYTRPTVMDANPNPNPSIHAHVTLLPNPN